MGNIIEQLFGGVLRAPLTTKANSAPNQWAGRTTLASGASTATVSTTQVRSNSIIQYGLQASTIAASLSSRPICVVSLVHGSYFAFGTADSVALPQSVTVMWNILRTD